MDLPLFRDEAIAAHNDAAYGPIVMTAPMTYGLLGCVFGLFALSIVLFAIFFSYTKRVTIQGQLVPDRGLLKIYAPQSGIVVAQYVTSGQVVKAGQALFVLSSDRESSTLGATQAAISTDDQTKKATANRQLATLQRMQQIEHESLERRRNALDEDLRTFGTLLEDQKRRYDLSLSALERYSSIAGQGYVSADELAQRQADVFDQKGKLQTLERDQSSTRRDLIDTDYQLDSLQLKYSSQIGDAQRNVADADEALTESEARRRLMVSAPGDGEIATITVHVGQLVDATKPLLTVVPVGSTIQADLYAPSKAIGFVTPGDAVSLRYQAYPYQKFGHYQGVVKEVAATALSSTELTGDNLFGTLNSQQSEPLYRVSVTLHSQFVTAYGTQHAVQAGMLVEADIFQERRSLLEWALEPLYTMSGKLRHQTAAQ